jgi:hypothetical protein
MSAAENVAAVLELQRRRREPLTVEIDSKGKPVFPQVPDVDDAGALCRWLTAVFSLDPARPIVAARWNGHRGPNGIPELLREDAPPIMFEPASRINTPAKLIETLVWSRVRGDGQLYAYAAPHSRVIAYVVANLCDMSRARSEEDQTHGLVSAFLSDVEMREGFTTYGTGQQRYEAAQALRPAVDEQGRTVGRYRALLDMQTGETVIRLSDLADRARRYTGGSVPSGWLDGRMESFGWERKTLDGHERPGREGKLGPYARVFVYRGIVPRPEVDDDETGAPDGC